MNYKKKNCTILFLDVAQAFDKALHEKLIYKLSAILNNVEIITYTYTIERLE